MDNLLPEFGIPIHEPSSTQTLAHFDVPSSLAPPSTPPKGIRSNGLDVVADLLHYAQAGRVSNNPNRLATCTAEVNTKVPVVLDTCAVENGPYYGKEEEIAINDKNRGEFEPGASRRVTRTAAASKQAKEEGVRVTFVNSCAEDEEGAEETSDMDNFGTYDLFLKAGSRLLNYEVPPMTNLSFNSSGQRYQGHIDDITDSAGTLMTQGVTFTLLRDDFTNIHFNAAMGATAVGPPAFEADAAADNIESPSKTIQFDASASVTQLDIDLAPTHNHDEPIEPLPFTTEEISSGGREFMATFSPSRGPLGMELGEITSSDGTYVVVTAVTPGGQASAFPGIKVNSVAIGVEGFPIRTLQNLTDVITSMTEVNPDVSVRIHFLNVNESPDGNGTGDEEFASEEKKEKEFFVTGGGVEVKDDGDDGDNLQASRVTAKATSLASTIPPPPPQPMLPLSLSASVDDTNPVTIFFQNKHSAYGMRISWIDYSGDLVPRKELLPGESYMERSFSTHPWVCTAVAWEKTGMDEHAREELHSGLGSFAKREAEVGNVAPAVSPSMVIRLGDSASSALKSYSVLWDPEIRSMSFMPAAKIATGRVRPWLAPENATSMNARIAHARAMVIQQIRDSRMDPMDGDKGLGAGSPNINIILFGNDKNYKSVFDVPSMYAPASMYENN
jgi:hypothetical protein